METEKAKGPGYEDLIYRLDEMVEVLASDFKSGKPLSWSVLPKERVHRVWADFVKHGSVRDERLLDAIFASIRDNVVRLQVATIVAEHAEISRDSILSEHLGEDQYEPFCEWLVDFNGVGRLSDYGLPLLQDAVALAFEARTPELRLKYLDRALNVVHQRGDLAKLFIEGGRSAVVEMGDIEEAFHNGVKLEASDSASTAPRRNRGP